MVGAVRFEPTAQTSQSPDKQSISESLAQANTQLASQRLGITCPELARIATIWENLPQHIKQTIITIVDTHAPKAVFLKH
jgi:hypothetical protein